MTVRYEYKSQCCGHEYVEQRGANEPMYFPKCNACGQSDYALINQEVLAPNIEVVPSNITIDPTQA